MTKIGYARVSSSSQDLGIQQAKLKAAGCEVIRSETVSGASRDDRSELETVMEFLRGGDELVVHRLDRLGRSTRDVLNLVHELDAKGASLRVLEPEVTTAGDMGRMVIAVLGMVADMELKFIRDRQRAGIEAAKGKGVYKGRQKSVDDQKIRELAGEGIAKAQIARNLGVSRMTVYRALLDPKTVWGIIPDLHADPALLSKTLKMLQNDGAKRFAFLGDFIDAGKGSSPHDDLAVLQKVRTLVDDGSACAVMGNHELNAILFHTVGEDGQPLRPHTEKNIRQHQSFINQIGVGTAEAHQWTAWFLDLPLWLELESFRLVHAYWGQAEIDLIASRRPDGRLRQEDLAEVATQSTAFGQAVQNLVCGPEIPLPDGLHFEDFRGNQRFDRRVAWWRAGAKTWQDIGLSVSDPSVLPQTDLPDRLATKYPIDHKMVFCGHYKMQGTPVIESPNVLCLDYPNDPCCYRVSGRALEAENIIKINLA